MLRNKLRVIGLSVVFFVGAIATDISAPMNYDMGKISESVKVPTVFKNGVRGFLGRLSRLDIGPTSLIYKYPLITIGTVGLVTLGLVGGYYRLFNNKNGKKLDVKTVPFYKKGFESMKSWIYSMLGLNVAFLTNFNVNADNLKDFAVVLGKISQQEKPEFLSQQQKEEAKQELDTKLLVQQKKTIEQEQQELLVPEKKIVEQKIKEEKQKKFLEEQQVLKKAQEHEKELKRIEKELEKEKLLFEEKKKLIQEQEKKEELKKKKEDENRLLEEELRRTKERIKAMELEELKKKEEQEKQKKIEEENKQKEEQEKKQKELEEKKKKEEKLKKEKELEEQKKREELKKKEEQDKKRQDKLKKEKEEKEKKLKEELRLKKEKEDQELEEKKKKDELKKQKEQEKLEEDKKQKELEEKKKKEVEEQKKKEQLEEEKKKKIEKEQQVEKKKEIEEEKKQELTPEIENNLENAIKNGKFLAIEKLLQGLSSKSILNYFFKNNSRESQLSSLFAKNFVFSSETTRDSEGKVCDKYAFEFSIDKLSPNELYAITINLIKILLRAIPDVEDVLCQDIYQIKIEPANKYIEEIFFQKNYYNDKNKKLYQFSILDSLIGKSHHELLEFYLNETKNIDEFYDKKDKSLKLNINYIFQTRVMDCFPQDKKFEGNGIPDGLVFFKILQLIGPYPCFETLFNHIKKNNSIDWNDVYIVFNKKERPFVPDALCDKSYKCSVLAAFLYGLASSIDQVVGGSINTDNTFNKGMFEFVLQLFIENKKEFDKNSILGLYDGTKDGLSVYQDQKERAFFYEKLQAALTSLKDYIELNYGEYKEAPFSPIKIPTAQNKKDFNERKKTLTDLKVVAQIDSLLEKVSEELKEKPEKEEEKKEVSSSKSEEKSKEESEKKVTLTGEEIKKVSELEITYENIKDLINHNDIEKFLGLFNEIIKDKTSLKKLKYLFKTEPKKEKSLLELILIKVFGLNISSMIRIPPYNDIDIIVGNRISGGWNEGKKEFLDFIQKSLEVDIKKIRWSMMPDPKGGVSQTSTINFALFYQNNGLIDYLLELGGDGLIWDKKSKTDLLLDLTPIFKGRPQVCTDYADRVDVNNKNIYKVYGDDGRIIPLQGLLPCFIKILDYLKKRNKDLKKITLPVLEDNRSDFMIGLLYQLNYFGNPDFSKIEYISLFEMILTAFEKVKTFGDIKLHDDATEKDEKLFRKRLQLGLSLLKDYVKKFKIKDDLLDQEIKKLENALSGEKKKVEKVEKKDVSSSESEEEIEEKPKKEKKVKREKKEIKKEEKKKEEKSEKDSEITYAQVGKILSDNSNDPATIIKKFKEISEQGFEQKQKLISLLSKPSGSNGPLLITLFNKVLFATAGSAEVKIKLEGFSGYDIQSRDPGSWEDKYKLLDYLIDDLKIDLRSFNQGGRKSKKTSAIAEAVIQYSTEIVKYLIKRKLYYESDEKQNNLIIDINVIEVGKNNLLFIYKKSPKGTDIYEEKDGRIVPKIGLLPCFSELIKVIEKDKFKNVTFLISKNTQLDTDNRCSFIAALLYQLGMTGSAEIDKIFNVSLYEIILEAYAKAETLGSLELVNKSTSSEKNNFKNNVLFGLDFLRQYVEKYKIPNSKKLMKEIKEILPEKKELEKKEKKVKKEIEEKPEKDSVITYTSVNAILQKSFDAPEKIIEALEDLIGESDNKKKALSDLFNTHKEGKHKTPLLDTIFSKTICTGTSEVPEFSVVGSKYTYAEISIFKKAPGNWDQKKKLLDFLVDTLSVDLRNFKIKGSGGLIKTNAINIAMKEHHLQLVEYLKDKGLYYDGEKTLLILNPQTIFAYKGSISVYSKEKLKNTDIYSIQNGRMIPKVGFLPCFSLLIDAFDDADADFKNTTVVFSDKNRCQFIAAILHALGATMNADLDTIYNVSLYEIALKAYNKAKGLGSLELIGDAEESVKEKFKGKVLLGLDFLKQYVEEYKIPNSKELIKEIEKILPEKKETEKKEKLEKTEKKVKKEKK